MKKAVLYIFCVCLISCGEKVVQEPEQLISKEKMADILYDLAILTAAKNTSTAILVKNKIETMEYLYTKYSVDSIQFVENNLYYASMPADYVAIYAEVDSRLESVQKKMEEVQKIKADSI
ncbi:MAG: phosphopentomutase, partial [Sediminicola sp.]